MGKARAGQGLFVLSYQINATEGAERGDLEERSYTGGVGRAGGGKKLL